MRENSDARNSKVSKIFRAYPPKSAKHKFIDAIPVDVSYTGTQNTVMSLRLGQDSWLRKAIVQHIPLWPNRFKY